MKPYLNWFNFMSYDIHGVWDGQNQFTGPYVRPHTNLTEIDEGLDLLWCNSIAPNAGPGLLRALVHPDRSVLHHSRVHIFRRGHRRALHRHRRNPVTPKITSVISANSLTPVMDAAAAIKWIVWVSNQWVSYDDGETVQMKMLYTMEKCLGGVMVWRWWVFQLANPKLTKRISTTPLTKARSNF
jgi:hypothetical protein